MDDCIEFSGAKLEGYGVKKINGKAQRAHRVAYCLANNIDIGCINGLVIMHTRDNMSCINPKHLKLGTHSENQRDKFDKNRQAKGETCGMSKLREIDIIYIRSNKNKKGLKELSDIFNVSIMQISRIIRNKQWKHIIGDENEVA